MGTVVALGEAVAVAGFALAGARVVVAETPEQVRRAWADLLEAGVAVVVLSDRAGVVLGAELDEPARPDRPLTAVLPP